MQALLPPADLVARVLALKEPRHLGTKAAFLDVLRCAFLETDWPFAPDAAAALLSDLGTLLKDALPAEGGPVREGARAAVYESVLPCLACLAGLPGMRGVLATPAGKAAGADVVRLAPVLERSSGGGAARAVALAVADACVRRRE